MHIFIWIFIVWMFGRIHVRACPGEVSYIEFRSRSSIRFGVLLIRMAIEYEDGQIMEICKTLIRELVFIPHIYTKWLTLHDLLIHRDSGALFEKSLCQYISIHALWAYIVFQRGSPSPCLQSGDWVFLESKPFLLNSDFKNTEGRGPRSSYVVWSSVFTLTNC